MISDFSNSLLISAGLEFLFNAGLFILMNFLD